MKCIDCQVKDCDIGWVNFGTGESGNCDKTEEEMNMEAIQGIVAGTMDNLEFIVVKVRREDIEGFKPDDKILIARLPDKQCENCENFLYEGNTVHLADVDVCDECAEEIKKDEQEAP